MKESVKGSWQAQFLNLFVTRVSDYHPHVISRVVEESKQGGATEVELALRNFKSSRGVKTGWSNRDRANDYNPRYAFVLL
ncbi:MAG TPA: hypothetical protein VE971_01430 [Candidatus Eisenbacteria bacterium]|nr:hypothetical protein [Candidatus Eisenbacteria bacterium]